MGFCTYPGCTNTRQGCFRPNCRFQPTKEYTAWDAFQDFRQALNDAERIYETEPMALDAINYVKQRLEQIQKAD